MQENADTVLEAPRDVDFRCAQKWYIIPSHLARGARREFRAEIERNSENRTDYFVANEAVRLNEPTQ